MSCIFGTDYHPPPETCGTLEAHFRKVQGPGVAGLGVRVVNGDSGRGQRGLRGGGAQTFLPSLKLSAGEEQNFTFVLRIKFPQEAIKNLHFDRKGHLISNF